jgi:hypothetical protein
MQRSWSKGRGVASLRAIGVIAACLGSSPLLAGADAPRSGGRDAVFNVRLRQTRDGFAVGQALQGAHRRLADSRCQEVFSDFTEPSGRSLQAVLDEQGQTGQSYLSLLIFYEGADAAGCRVPGVLAFTHPGSRVVFVCSKWFREASALNPAKVEAVIIHESLHSLGLGENPPRSQDITARVVARCGG